MTRAPKPRSFDTPAEFRAWLEKHHATESELLVRCFKVQACDRGMTYPQAVDEALCFGWIDGVRRRLDADSFNVRFTPRKPRSIWSTINTRRARQLEAEGRMHAAGLAAFGARNVRRSGIYSFESKSVGLDAAFMKKLRANKRAWTWFQAQPPSYRRTCAFWVMSAKREDTRLRRLDVLIDCSARGRTVPPLTRYPRVEAKQLSTQRPKKGRPRSAQRPPDRTSAVMSIGSAS